MKKHTEGIPTVTPSILADEEKQARGERDCGSSSCLYAKRKTGMRTNGHCTCDECPFCGVHVRNGRTHKERCVLA